MFIELNLYQREIKNDLKKIHKYLLTYNPCLLYFTPRLFTCNFTAYVNNIQMTLTHTKYMYIINNNQLNI